MCGILAALGLSGAPETIRRKVLVQSRLLRHRGPDANAIWQSADGKNCIAFERLQIIDVSDNGKYVSCEALGCQPQSVSGSRICWVDDYVLQRAY